MLTAYETCDSFGPGTDVQLLIDVPDIGVDCSHGLPILIITLAFAVGFNGYP